MASEIKVDTISEKTSAGGVTIDGLLIKDGGISGDVSLIGTTPTFTIGDAGAEDAALVFDGNAKDFYVALDDSADKLVIGEGSTVGTNSILTITDDSVTVGDAAAVDTKIVFDGNAQDYHIGLDDSADTLVLGLGSTLGTTPAMTVNSSQVVTFAQNPVFPDGGVAVADLDIDGATDIGADIVDADLFIIDDGAGGTNRKTVASRLKTYIGGGISHAQIWNMNTAFTGGGNPISSNWAETWTNDIGDANSLGSSSVTQSSGIFTFGATGIWKVEFHIHFTDNGGVDKDIFAEIWKTENNSTYVSSSRAGAALYAAAGNSSARASALYDITDTSNQKVQFRNGSTESDTTTYGHGTYIMTYAIFIRLGDT